MPTREEKNIFSEAILLKAQKDGSSCMEAIILHCEDVGLEVEVAATLVNDILKARLAEEAMALNYIEKSAKLPL